MNYYEILGLSYGASISDVKASFRQLAKLYHPDVNPEGLEHFAKVLRAYETLSDPVLKQSYDYKLNYHQAQTQQQTTAKTNKTWSFSEKELKRRQYYDEHIRKYAKQTGGSTATTEVKPHYNEFRYILYATPLAVILFLLIMSLANRSNPSFSEKNGSPAHDITHNPTNIRLQTGDDPYGSLFGSPQYELNGGHTLLIKNASGKDMIVCLFTKESFVRSFYVADNFSAEIPQLPDERLFVNFSSGLNFDKSLYLEQAGVTGAFSTDLSFYKAKNSIDPKEVTELSLGFNAPGFDKTNSLEFFKRMIH
ncbi:MAG: J domain-containing protein [Bacteroidia bacterium]|nr:J domain-containing protein [Bacteroidia bacterium]